MGLEQRIKTRAESAALLSAGEFGNRARDWPSLEHYLADPTRPAIAALRMWSRPGEQLPKYCMGCTEPELIELWETWRMLGIDMRQVKVYTLTNGQEGGRIVLQGEVSRERGPLWLRASRSQRVMRYAWEEDQINLFGLQAHLAIKHAMDAPSWENLWSLFDRWPGATVEFSCFEETLGTHGWNTIFWEVRNY